MKRKKQIKVIISFLVMIAVLLGGWGLMKQERLSAADRIEISPESTKTDDCGSKPQPPTALLPGQDIEVPKDFPGNLNVLDLKDGFHIVKLSNAEINDPYCQKNAQIFNPSLIDPLNYPIKDGYDWKNTVQMVQPYQQQRGAIWYEDAILLNKDFAGEFEFFLGNIDFITNPLFEGVRMADGITFTLQNDSLNAIGSSSWGMGVSGFSEGSPLNQGFVKNALSIQIRSDGGSSGKSGKINTAFPQEVGIMPTYNGIWGDTKGNITDGSWAKVEYLWDHEEEIFKYRLVLLENQPNHFGPNAGLWQEINFKEATATSRQYEQDSTGNYATTMTETTKNVLELRAGGTLAGAPLRASGYFNGDKVYWGFTGATSGALNDKNSSGPVQPLNPIVSIGQTPNQSQSPLQLSMKKLGKIGDSAPAPLEGAKFILQKQNATTKAWQQVIPDGVSGNDLKDLVFTTDDSGEIIVSAFDEHGVLQKTQQQLIENITANSASYRFREVAVPKDSSYVQPPTIPNQDPENFVYSGEEPEHSATLFSTAAKLLNGNSTTTESQDDGYFGEVYNNTPPTIELTKFGVESKPLSGVEMTIGAKVTDKTTNQQKVMSLAQLANEVKKMTTYKDITLKTNASGKITLPPDQIPLMMDLASSSLDVYKSLDQWVFIETKAADDYQPSPFTDGNWQVVPEAYKNKFIFNITDNWTSAEDIKTEYPVPAANALNQFTISPEAIGPEGEPLADASFTINDTPISNPYALTVGTAASAPTYTLKQTNTNDGYASAQPVTFKLVQTPNKINEFTVTVEGNNTGTYFEFYYMVGEEKRDITPGTAFTSSEFLENPTLFISLVNQPIGEFALIQINPLDYGKISLPQKNPNELIKRENSDWKVQFTDTRLDAYRTPLKLSVILDKNFTKTGDPTKTISGILLYRPNATTPITPDDFLIEGEEIPIKEKINPNSGTNDIDWPEQAGFLLQIDAEKQTKIFAGDYQAELTFILSEDPL